MVVLHLIGAMVFECKVMIEDVVTVAYCRDWGGVQVEPIDSDAIKRFWKAYKILRLSFVNPIRYKESDHAMYILCHHLWIVEYGNKRHQWRHHGRSCWVSRIHKAFERHHHDHVVVIHTLLLSVHGIMSWMMLPVFVAVVDPSCMTWKDSRREREGDKGIWQIPWLLFIHVTIIILLAYHIHTYTHTLLHVSCQCPILSTLTHCISAHHSINGQGRRLPPRKLHNGLGLVP